MVQQTQQEVQRLVGVASTVAGLICYALSSSFNNLFGNWSLFKIFAYIVSSSIICLAAFFPKAWQRLRIPHHYGALFAFLVLISTSVYSSYLGIKSKTKPDAYDLISSAAFATTSLCMSKQIECGFLDLMYFFCGLLIGQLMEIKPLLAFVGICFTGFLIILRSYLNAPPPRSCTYEVFLSFAGSDTRRGFTSHLYAALERKGIKTFIAEKDLKEGEVASVVLLKAIEESMFAIVVLSPDYASNTWCLDELYEIVECSKNMGLEVVPVFYGVKPSDVRYQKGSFEQAFQRHQKRFGQNRDKVKRWRDALVAVANLSGFVLEGFEERSGQNSEKIRRWRDALAVVASLLGWHSKVARHSKDKDEATLAERIAEYIHKELIKKLPSSTKNIVGIDSSVKEVLIDVALDEDVRYIGGIDSIKEVQDSFERIENSIEEVEDSLERVEGSIEEAKNSMEIVQD